MASPGDLGAARAGLDEDLGTVLVTGGAGWLGSRLVRALLDLGSRCQRVHVLDVVPWRPATAGGELVAGTAGEGEDTRVIVHSLDLRDASAVRALIHTIRPRVIFHLASVVDVRPIWTQIVEDINVGGTTNVVLAASSCGDTHALVYCSSLDVVYAGMPMDHAAETLPYTSSKSLRWWVPGDFYAPSKARAEQIALAASTHANAGAGLRTAALRPAHLFGEHDAILDLFTRLPVACPARGEMTMQYVGNTAALHIMTARRLLHERRHSAAPVVSGQVFNIGDFDTPFCQFYGSELQPRHAGYRPPWLLPVPIMVPYFAGLALDGLDFVIYVVALLLTPLAMAAGCRRRGHPLLWRLPRHPALCLSSTGALLSAENFRMSRAKGHECFGYHQLYGFDPACTGGLEFVSRDESVRRTRQWAQNKLVSGVGGDTQGYGFRGDPDRGCRLL